MSDLIDFLLFSEGIDYLLSVEEMSFFQFSLMILAIVNNFAWIVFLTILPFALILILISLTKGLIKWIKPKP